jgi:multicomponent Na+:H+ antiporter subunit B
VKIKILIIVILVILSIFTMLNVIVELPTYGKKDNPIHNQVYKRYVENSIEDTGVPNMVTSIVLDYRAYDTMFETIVLFAATTAVIVALKAAKKEGDNK